MSVIELKHRCSVLSPSDDSRSYDSTSGRPDDVQEPFLVSSPDVSSDERSLETASYDAFDVDHPFFIPFP